ncbi:hypothetical protein CAY59_09405 [Vibrio campbellii]|uniref:DUF7661 family protein n=1 Tax=Vibrio campbellii TaxID=680 RepID=UPI000A2FC849|nr:hypothetical protein [Vibrio campbellii]ARR44548.1 hypothetical protein CAY59_09405 [Vibrio campbellii]
MSSSIKVNVFGKIMLAECNDGIWTLYIDSETSIKRPIRDFVVPPFLDEDELLTYLDDMYHEHATATHPCVFRVE